MNTMTSYTVTAVVLIAPHTRVVRTYPVQAVNAKQAGVAAKGLAGLGKGTVKIQSVVRS